MSPTNESPTVAPFEDPTSGTAAPFTGSPNINSKLDATVGVLVNIAAAILLMNIIAFCFWTYRRRNKQMAQRHEGTAANIELSNAQEDCLTSYSLSRNFEDSVEVRDGVIACIPIGQYDDSNYRKLPVRRDVENIKKLSIFLSYKFIEIPDKEYWTKEDVTYFLVNDVGSKLFHKKSGNPKHDCLLVFVTGHGQRHSVVTSDGELFDRADIHRCISVEYPRIREIPRLFVFDACSGSAKREHTIEIDSDEFDDESEPLNTISDENVAKNEFACDIGVIKKQSRQWTTSQPNPDYKLMVIESANIGFQANMRHDDVGSLLIYEFIMTIIESIRSHDRRSLAENLDKIQQKLHEGGKQLINYTPNNGTGKLRLEMGSSERKVTV